jgi:hypothetical protein
MRNYDLFIKIIVSQKIKKIIVPTKAPVCFEHDFRDFDDRQNAWHFDILSEPLILLISLIALILIICRIRILSSSNPTNLSQNTHFLPTQKYVLVKTNSIGRRPDPASKFYYPVQVCLLKSTILTYNLLTA